MRSVFLFAIRVLVPASVLAYVLWLLAAPCMPLSDTMGEAQAVPRWEFWLLHASVPSATWWQWTGGLQPVMISDRIPILLAAAIWLSVCYLIGSLISRFDSIFSRLSRYERIGVSILVGHSTLSALVFCHCTLFGLQSIPLLLIGTSVIAVVLSRFRRLSVFQQTLAEDRSSPDADTTSIPADVCSEVQMDSSVDNSFDSSINRRMIGLLLIATTYLACIQVYGATMPTQDMHVREVDWWIAKHVAQNGKIDWFSENALANAPNHFIASSLAIISFLTVDVPAVPSDGIDTLMRLELWNSRLVTGVLAGKTVNALLCIVGILLAGVHLGRRWGYLSGLFVCFLLVATPGIVELTRLGRTEALIAIWCIGLLVGWNAYQRSILTKPSSGLVMGLLLAGAITSGYGSAVLIGVPPVILWVCRRVMLRAKKNAGAQIRKLIPVTLMASVVLTASAQYIHNFIASGDAIYPWGSAISQQLGFAERTATVDKLRHAYRVPAETISEVASANSQEFIPSLLSEKSPYRLINLWDVVSRLLWNSNVHGLMLVPFAIVGMLFSRNLDCRLATVWFFYWMSILWCFSMRQDREWVGAMFLLAWPAAAGAQWMVQRAKGLWMMFMVSIAIVWSIVVIPIWPTSDNRILVALETLLHNDKSHVMHKSTEEDTSIDRDYTARLNDLIERTKGFERSKILLVGESDDFDFLTNCLSNGPFDRGLWDKCLDLPSTEIRSVLRSSGISHLLFVWSGVRYRELLTGTKTESAYRNALRDLLTNSQLEAIPWEINSSHAELYRVIE